LESNKFISFLELNCLINKMCLSSHVGPIVIDVFPQEEKVVPEEVGAPQAPSNEDPNFAFGKG
jgi:hypothetical protein